MKYEEYIMAIAPFEDFRNRAISARINRNNEVILIGYLYEDCTDYKIEKEYKLNDLF